MMYAQIVWPHLTIGFKNKNLSPTNSSAIHFEQQIKENNRIDSVLLWVFNIIGKLFSYWHCVDKITFLCNVPKGVLHKK